MDEDEIGRDIERLTDECKAWRTLAIDAAEMVSFKEAAWHQRLEQLLKEYPV